MREEQREFFDIMSSFRRLNISSMLPDINHGDFGILKMIDHCRTHCDGEGVKVSDIVRHMKIQAPAVSRSLRSLERSGYIVRSVDRRDRRNTYVELTDMGKDMLTETDAIMNDFADAVFGKMGDENMKKLNSFLREFLETSQKEIALRRYKGKKGETENEENF